jgi:hypothetical protein
MDQRQQEYVAYYEARLRNVAGNPLYPHTEAAERALYEAIRSAPSLEAFRERLEKEKLEVGCAVARVRDQATARAALYEELEEPVRAGPEKAVLALLESRTFDDVQSLTEAVGAIEGEWRLRISADETLIDHFWGDWKILEDIEESEQAIVPHGWHPERLESAARERQKGAEHYRKHTLPETRKFFPDYEPDYQALWAVRHRRKMPVADPIVQRRIAGHRRYRGID